MNSWIELSASNYAHNIQLFRNHLDKKAELSVVVKANAYGHGLFQIATLANKSQVKTFCLHSLEEAIKLRELGFKQKMLILGYVSLSQLQDVVLNEFHISIFNKESLAKISDIIEKIDKNVYIHLKLDTGMGRLGILENEMPWFIDTIKKNKKLILEAVYSHFSNADKPNDSEYTFLQIDNFINMCKLIKKSGISIFKTHIANSSATLLYFDFHFNMVRIGISQYGLWPSKETCSVFSNEGKDAKKKIYPVLSWKTIISQIKWVPKDCFISYGCTFKTVKDTLIAVLPIGYSDGYDRRLSNKSYVLVKGKRVPVIGRICMNLMIIDVTGISGLELEEEVVLIGKQGKEEITAEYLASLIGTINYEIITRINWEIERIVV